MYYVRWNISVSGVSSVSVNESFLSIAIFNDSFWTGRTHHLKKIWHVFLHTECTSANPSMNQGMPIIMIFEDDGDDDDDGDMMNTVFSVLLVQRSAETGRLCICGEVSHFVIHLISLSSKLLKWKAWNSYRRALRWRFLPIGIQSLILFFHLPFLE